MGEGVLVPVIGKMNRRVTLQAESIARGGAGQAKRAFTDIATVWAHIENLREREISESDKHTVELNVRVTIRYRKDVRREWRIKIDDERGERGIRTLGITGIINPNDGRHELRLICRELSFGEPV